MGAVGSRQLNPVQLSDYQQATGLSAEQLEQLHTRFRSLDRHQRGYLTPTDLLRIPQLSLNPLHRQIVDGFFPSREPSARLGFDQFVEACATVLVPQFGRGELGRHDRRAKKLRLLSKIFDTRRSGCITREDFRQIMRSLLDPIWNHQLAQDGECQLEQEQEQAKYRKPEVEVELQLLEQQAFGASNRNQISYEEFEQRLYSADVDGRLSIAKWLVDEDEAGGHELPDASGP
ncbi:calcineurin B homologous protein 2 [Drosophila ficusphila]|uniref:calcineurin B homologous protein 2 n=1 Tax=Drosophila ficusphila TaxID=30025 RepID=UPI0007E79A5C|nr:calcineurin B homologous protein 2 [Drosophila ficusphila]XP_017054858.1 calcineurin B homologous protein 2 [Drosophila ficusphila]XP_017054859.1 calcineurin B homologous protein 2 [Drosophila ficusphila]XP_043063495.1 calcineurin B homologous protein 2 [Drosophila ficusphila]